MYVLGINLSHDRAACLLRDGRIVAAVEEERLDRLKHSEGFIIHGHFEKLSKVLPMKAITYCLDAAGIGIDDVDVVVGNRPLGDEARERILRELPIRDKSKVHSLPMPSHHLTHAYAGYLASPFDEAAVLVVDGVGSKVPGTGRIEKHTIFDGDGTSLRRVHAETFPEDWSEVGLGLFYSFFSAKLGFVTRWGHPTFGDFGCGGYTEAGKTMGLAPYGRPRPEWQRLLTVKEGNVVIRTEDMEKAWDSWYASDGDGYDAKQKGSWQHQFAKDVAYKIQAETEEAMLELARYAHEVTGRSKLCLTGGVALNSVANQRIVAEGPFDEVYILPPAGDAGTAIGAAYYGYYSIAGGTERHPVRSGSTGRHYSDQEIEQAVRAAGEKVESRRATVAEVAALLAEHRLVGWFQGGSEIGPRALGHRSMLADPRHPEVRDYLNEVVKHREVFRPFAPSVLGEEADAWFEMHGDSPFMLLVPEVREGLRTQVPAITHVDGTARVQTVEPDVNPRYHELISHFAELTGVPLVLNTSYNDAGEPIVETPADAVRTFLNTELDHLYIGDLLLTKPGRELPERHPSRRPLA
ncbi:carbamoyltransferase C-terminal domain-containing protein [Streptomyces sp. TRM76323]|uniref:Carbamoyltransferase C-terminal domain-containing protein n=1 Tax=Streptomyces tamarix TaxID=3078565 RepID=A0ABU3QKZ1_9ACTN|nr:carbamoyltransferase C-terminal domain-containing protein [Streptomyces tamarix]MDT9683059.1 carbamoyltransferase C-terminal domain-containing protein [Streptomyces tamarix]